MARFSAPGAGLGCLLVALGLIGRAPAASADGPGAGGVRGVALGGSITRGGRPGVRSDETFASLGARGLRADGRDAEGGSLAGGGARTDQALKRLDAGGELRPRVVTVMYGTNDCHVDRGSSASRISR